MENDFATILICGCPERVGMEYARCLGVHYSSIYTCDSVADALKLLSDGSVDLILAWHADAAFDALSLLKKARIYNPRAVRVLIGDLSCAELHEAVNEAAIYQFLPLHSSIEQVELQVIRALEYKELGHRYRHLSHELRIKEDMLRRHKDGRGVAQACREFGGFVHCSPAMADLCSVALQAAETDQNILLQGPEGSGKALMAHAIHSHSGRSARPLWVQRIRGIAEGALQAALFGAPAGTPDACTGVFAAAGGGTVFLQDLAYLSSDLQLKLLHLLRNEECGPSPGGASIRGEVRVITASSRSLDELVKEGSFNESLYYRLGRFQLTIPPLCMRNAEIEALSMFFTQRHAASVKREIPGIDLEVTECFKKYNWPGNVRELEDEIKRMVEMTPAGNLVSMESMPAHILRPHTVSAEGGDSLLLNGVSLKTKVCSMEQKIIRATLHKFAWNKSLTAVELGLSRAGLYSKMKRYGIVPGHDTP